MDPKEKIRGSIEIVTADGRSIGLPGVKWSEEAIPVVLEALYGITDTAPETPGKRPSGRIPKGKWKARDMNNQDVEVLLWPEVPFDETLIGKAIAQALAKSDGA